jgi:small-conductance mechanosensitive channel
MGECFARLLWLGFLALITWRVVSVASIVSNSLVAYMFEHRGQAYHRLERTRSVVAGESAMELGRTTAQVCLTVLFHIAGLVFFLDQVGIPVSGIISSLGFLGIVTTLGSQYLFPDLAAYVAIVLGASIAENDWIVVSSRSVATRGQVERIGYLRTQVRSLDGELLIYNNREIASAYVTNCSRQPHRLVSMPLELAATTPASSIEKARSCGMQAVESIRQARLSDSSDPASNKRNGTWQDLRMEFDSVYVNHLGDAQVNGFSLTLYFYLGGATTKPQEFEAKSLVYIEWLSLLQEASIKTQGAVITSSLSSLSLGRQRKRARFR